MRKSNLKSLILAAVALSVTGSIQAEERIGEREFMTNCAVCHGANGKGDGAIIDFLKQAPADLTKMREKNNGQFPMQQVYDTIVDVDKTRAHGNRDMPIWGDRYASAVIEEEGEYGMSSAIEYRARVLELVFFLATIQE